MFLTLLWNYQISFHATDTHINSPSIRTKMEGLNLKIIHLYGIFFHIVQCNGNGGAVVQETGGSVGNDFEITQGD